MLFCSFLSMVFVPFPSSLLQQDIYQFHTPQPWNGSVDHPGLQSFFFVTWRGVMQARIPWASRTSCLKALLGCLTERSIITSQSLGCELSRVGTKVPKCRRKESPTKTAQTSVFFGNFHEFLGSLLSHHKFEHTKHLHKA